MALGVFSDSLKGNPQTPNLTLKRRQSISSIERSPFISGSCEQRSVLTIYRHQMRRVDNYRPLSVSSQPCPRSTKAPSCCFRAYSTTHCHPPQGRIFRCKPPSEYLLRYSLHQSSTFSVTDQTCPICPSQLQANRPDRLGLGC